MTDEEWEEFKDVFPHHLDIEMDKSGFDSYAKRYEQMKKLY